MPKAHATGVIHHRVFGRVHVLLNSPKAPADDSSAPYAYFEIDSEIMYEPFFEDFGPTNLLMLYKFCRKLDDMIQCNPHRSTALCVAPDLKAQTAAALFLGTYMVMLMDFNPDDVEHRLAPLRTIPFRDILFRDNMILTSATGSIRKRKGLNECSGFGLSVRDCLDALRRAKGLRWIDLAQAAQLERNECNGCCGFDADEYKLLDNPLNADLHEVYGVHINCVHTILNTARTSSAGDSRQASCDALSTGASKRAVVGR
jgi:hypothetical protein